MLVRMLMIAITIMSSMKVNPLVLIVNQLKYPLALKQKRGSAREPADLTKLN